MVPGEINQVITVTGEAPLVDTTTTTVGANLSETLYRTFRCSATSPPSSAWLPA